MWVVFMKIRNHLNVIAVTISTFFLKSGLKRHISYVHEGLKPFKCNICGLYYAQKINLKTHMSQVHDGIKRAKPKHKEKKTYELNICNNIFTCKSSLKQHINGIHEKIKPHKCYLC